MSTGWKWKIKLLSVLTISIRLSLNLEVISRKKKKYLQGSGNQQLKWKEHVPLKGIKIQNSSKHPARNYPGS